MTTTGITVGTTSDDNNGRPPTLGRRAPTKPIATRTWEMYLDCGIALVGYKNVLEQKNQCVRCRIGHVSNQTGIRLRLSALEMLRLEYSTEASRERTGFPYPPKFRDIIREQLPLTAMRQMTKHNIDFGFSTSWFTIKRTSVIESETQVQPLYLVVGIFSRRDLSPHERVVFVHKPENLFREISWACFRLRGLTGTFLSLRHVKGFRLYQCDAKSGTHKSVDLDADAIADLQLLLQTYKSWHVPDYIAKNWACWVHETINDSSYNIIGGKYSLELELGWSSMRITIVVLLPVLLSLGIGLWLNAKNWTDLATIQTAWGTASYVVTAGGLLAALLGILSGISE